MGVPRKLLLDDERVLAHTRTHLKSMLWPFAMGMIVVFAGSYAAARAGDLAGLVARLVVVGLAVVLLSFSTIAPFLRWYHWTYNLTNLRFIEQRGVLSRTGRVIPLNRINDVSFEKSLLDRMLGCGTLVLHDAGRQEGLQIHDIPRVEQMHRQISRLVLTTQHDDGHRPLPGGNDDREATVVHDSVLQDGAGLHDGAGLYDRAGKGDD